MRTINACLVIMITILGLTNAFDFASIREIQSLKQNSFAASLIETISLSLSSNKQNGVADVLKMLQELEKQLKDDQVRDDNVFKAKNAEFNTHIEKLNAAIEKLTNEITQLQQRIEELTGLIAQAEINIVSFTERIGNLTQSIIDIDEKLEQDKKYYTSRAEGLQQVHDKLLVVNERLGEMVGSVSGVGIKDHINRTAAEVRDIEYMKNHPAANSFIQLSKSIPLASNLVEMTLQADQKALQTLMNIIAKFAQQCLDEKAEAEQKLQEAIETHEALRAQMVEEKRLNTEARARQIANKKAYEAERAEKEALKKQKEERREALRKELALNQALQKQLRDTYEKEKRDRAEEIQVVEILINIVNKRLMK